MLIVMAQTNVDQIRDWLTPLGTFLGGLAAMLIVIGKVISKIRATRTIPIPTSPSTLIATANKRFEAMWSVAFWSSVGAFLLLFLSPLILLDPMLKEWIWFGLYTVLLLGYLAVASISLGKIRLLEIELVKCLGPNPEAK